MRYYNESNAEWESGEGENGRPYVDAKQTNLIARTTRYTVGLAPILIADQNPRRIAFNVTLAQGVNETYIYIRYYGPDQDNNYNGTDILYRFFPTGGKNTRHRDRHEMPSNAIYTGEISAFAAIGAGDIIVTEY